MEYSYLIGWELVLVLVLVQDSTESWGGVGKKKKGNGSNIGRFFGGVHYKIIKKNGSAANDQIKIKKYLLELSKFEITPAKTFAL